MPGAGQPGFSRERPAPGQAASDAAPLSGSLAGPVAGAGAGAVAGAGAGPVPAASLRRLVPFLRPYWPQLTLVALIALVSTAVGLAVPLAAKFLVDEVAVAGRPDRLLPIAGLLFALGLAAMAVRSGGQALHAWTTSHVLFDVRLALYRRMVRLSPEYFAARRSGDLLSRLTADVAEAQSALSDGALGLAMAVLAAATSGIALFWLSWKLALVSLLATPLLALSVYWLRPHTMAVAKDLREQAADATAFLSESLAGMNEIQAFGLERRMADRYGDLNRRFVGKLMRQQGLGALAEALPALCMGAATLGVLGLGAGLIQAGAGRPDAELTWGGLVAFLAYQWRFQGPIRGISALYLRLQRARVALGRVLEIADVPEALRPGGGPVPPGLAMQDIDLDALSYQYGDRPALRDLSATVRGGSVTAVVGASGAGKSTLIRLLLRVLEPTAGQIRAGGVPLASLDGDAWRMELAVVGQDTFLFHDSILENVRLARPEATEAEVEEALGAAGLEAVVRRLPEGDATVVGERGARLSGGERQRVSLARALLRHPALLILDEATAALDPLTEEAVWETLAGRKALGATTLLVTHRIGTAMRADHVLVLDHGRLAQAGAPWDLARQQGPFAALLAAYGATAAGSAGPRP